MSGYLPEIRFETNYEESKVVFTLKPLTRLQFVTILPSLQNAGQDKNQMALFEVAASVLRDSVVRVDGLLDANQRPVEKDEMIETAYFTDLCLRVFNHLMQSSVMGKMLKPGSEERSPASIVVRG